MSVSAQRIDVSGMSKSLLAPRGYVLMALVHARVHHFKSLNLAAIYLVAYCVLLACPACAGPCAATNTYIGALLIYYAVTIDAPSCCNCYITASA